MYSGRPSAKDKYTARHKTERPTSDYAKVPRELDQYIVDPTTKKRYLRGRFLGKVPTSPTQPPFKFKSWKHLERENV